MLNHKFSESMAAAKSFFLTTFVIIVISLHGYYSMPQQVNSSALCKGNVTSECSRWSYLDNSTCKCFRNRNDIFICDGLGVREAILSCFCLTYNDVLNTTEVGHCLYNCYYTGKSTDLSRTYNTIPRNISQLDDALCGRYDRTGTLCGQCRKNKYLPAYSYNMSCTPCDGGWEKLAKYMAIAYVPLTCFCLVIIVFNVNIPTSSMQGYIFTSQIISCPLIIRTIILALGRDREYFKFEYTWTFLLFSVYGIWNLDFFRLINFNLCFKIHPLTVLTLNLFIALFPMLFILFSYFIANLYWNNNKVVVLAVYPFKKVIGLLKLNCDLKKSTVHAFSTFMYLSHVKFLNISCDLLSPVHVCDTANNSTCRWAVFNDASVTYFSKTHLFYAVPALAVLIVMVWAPIFFLMLNSCPLWRQCLPVQWKVSLHVIMDSFQGCYKDGTEPHTRDCRWFSAMPFIAGNVLYILSTIIFSRPLTEYLSIFLTLIAILFIIQDPFKSHFKTYSDQIVINLLVVVSFLASIRFGDFQNEGTNFTLIMGIFLFLVQHALVVKNLSNLCS